MRTPKSTLLAGTKVAFFTLLEKSDRRDSHNNKVYWRCQCDCGNIFETRSCQINSTIRGQTYGIRSCGCKTAELRHAHQKLRMASGLPGWRHRHGKSQSTEHRIWSGLKQRCLNPKNPAYALYGGRGITVCERWAGKQGFDNFLADMGARPEGMSLDRIDVNGGYSPDNCRWATRKVQTENRRKHVFVEEARLRKLEALAEQMGVKL